jgi:alkylation response protein AidB-like acyl-CoA dehydrogenase
VDLDLTDDQTSFQDMLNSFFDKESAIAVVRDCEPLGFDAVLWRKVVELGLTSVGVPEGRGGGGAGMLELAIAAEALGRSLAPVPLIEAAVVNNLLASLRPAAAEPELESLAAAAIAGELLATLAVRPVEANIARAVPAGAVADLVVVLRGEELLLVRQPDRSPDKPGAAIANLGSLPLADCPIAPASTLTLARGPAAVGAHRQAVAQWQLLTGAALVGLGFRALEIGVDYVLQRRAFGVLIGTFQTIQHRLADNVVALEGARLLTHKAAWADDENLPTAAGLAQSAFLFGAGTAFRTAAESLHFHGGYGYTLEYDIQLYFRRAKAWPLVAGDPRAAYAQLAHRLFDSQEG